MGVQPASLGRWPDEYQTLELRGVVEVLVAWGVRWIGELGEQDLDPHLLMWDIRRTVQVDAWPRGRTVVAFELDVVPSPSESRLRLGQMKSAAVDRPT